MILTKLMIVEFNAENEPIQNSNKIKAIHSIKNLLSQIDFSAEVVPMENEKKLGKLLRSLKKGRLNTDEKKLIKELVSF